MKPNILIVVIDSMRADHLSCYGYARPTSPNIDRIAAEGCRLDNAITAAPFSPASYASIFSNLYSHQHGVNGDTVRVWPERWPRLAEKMKRHGYRTFCVSNNTFVSEEMNSTRGFDHFQGPRSSPFMRQYHRTNRRIRKFLGDKVGRCCDSNRLLCRDKGDSQQAVDAARTLIEQGSEPFFGFVILMDPHALYHPKRMEFATDARATRSFLKRINGRQMWPRLMAEQRLLAPHDLRAALDLYDGEILHADRCLGTLVDGLRDAGRLENTILAVCADHGEAFGEQGVWGHGFSLLDCLIRVPLILRHPTYWKPGSRSSALVQLHALHEMCLSVAEDGVPRTQEHPHCLTQAGQSAWKGDEVVFSEFPVQTGTLAMFQRHNPQCRPGRWAQAMWAARSTEWHYIEYDNGGQELYDLLRDPAEKASIHEAQPGVCREFHERLEAHRGRESYQPTTTDVQATSVIDDSILDRLRALGYIE